MKITDTKVKLINDAEKFKASVAVTIDDCFVIHNIKVIDGKNGLFISMPGKRNGDGKYDDICHPINSDTRKLFSDTILQAYNEAVESNTLHVQ